MRPIPMMILRCWSMLCPIAFNSLLRTVEAFNLVPGFSVDFLNLQLFEIRFERLVAILLPEFPKF